VEWATVHPAATDARHLRSRLFQSQSCPPLKWPQFSLNQARLRLSEKGVRIRTLLRRRVPRPEKSGQSGSFALPEIEVSICAFGRVSHSRGG
jgi:hypothetical protein